MATTPHEPRRADTALVLEPMPTPLLDEPLEFIFADHFRQRSLGVALKRIAAVGEVSRSEADAIVGFISHDLRLHHQDEDEDFFPVLRRRKQPEDDLDAALDRLEEDHRRSGPVERRIVAALASQPDAPVVAVPRSVRQTLLDYAAREHRHLAVENGIVLAIARIRLTKQDLNAMSAGMKARRGIGAHVPHP
jgi:hemerythrin-like domain-containing protein